MNKESINIWGRIIELEVVFDCYSGEDVLPSQHEALDCFLKKPCLIEECKSKVEEYCLRLNKVEIGSDKIDNIFKYVLPKSLYVQRNVDNSHVIGLMCAYKFNPDDGITVVFKNEKFSEIGTQNIIL